MSEQNENLLGLSKQSLDEPSTPAEIYDAMALQFGADPNHPEVVKQRLDYLKRARRDMNQGDPAHINTVKARFWMRGNGEAREELFKKAQLYAAEEVERLARKYLNSAKGDRRERLDRFRTGCEEVTSSLWEKFVITHPCADNLFLDPKIFEAAVKDEVGYPPLEGCPASMSRLKLDDEYPSLNERIEAHVHRFLSSSCARSGGRTDVAAPPSMRGPKADVETAKKVFEVVKGIAPDGIWRSRVDEILQALDEKSITRPKTWRRLKRDWLDSGNYGRKAIEHHLKNARKRLNLTFG